MLQYTFFDTTIFVSEIQAKSFNEVYSCEYKYPIMVITDPDGNRKELPMNYRPVAGLDVSDHQTLFAFINESMEAREAIAKKKRD